MAKFKKKFNFKSMKTWKKVLLVGLAGLTLVGAVAGIGALLNKAEEDTKIINPSYAIGGLTEQGQYLETKESIYTKNAFGCQGLDVELAFDNNISYRIFFYNNDNDFISATKKQTSNYDEDLTPINAVSCRVVITPNDDDKISWYEINDYAKQIEISVNKEQTPYKPVNLYQIDSSLINKKIDVDTGEIIDGPNFYISNWIDVKAGQKYVVGFEDNYVVNQTALFYLKHTDGTIDTSESVKLVLQGTGEMVWFDFVVPEDVVSVCLMANNATGVFQEFTINLK